MYGTILLAYDGTREGRLALREGAMLARTCGARVVLVAVVETYAGVSFAGGPDAVYVPPVDNREEVEKVLQEGAERLKRLGLAHEVRLEQGAPADRITAVAKEVGADLVVVGHQKLGSVTRWLLGSVTGTLTDSLECSLLVARREVPDDELFGPGGAG